MSKDRNSLPKLKGEYLVILRVSAETLGREMHEMDDLVNIIFRGYEYQSMSSKITTISSDIKRVRIGKISVGELRNEDV